MTNLGQGAQFSINNPAEGHHLIYDSTDGVFKNQKSGSGVTVSDTAPTDPKNGDIWIDTDDYGINDIYQLSSQKTTTISSNSTDTQYPSAAAVYKTRELHIGMMNNALPWAQGNCSITGLIMSVRVIDNWYEISFNCEFKPTTNDGSDFSGINKTQFLSWFNSQYKTSYTTISNIFTKNMNTNPLLSKNSAAYGLALTNDTERIGFGRMYQTSGTTGTWGNSTYYNNGEGTCISAIGYFQLN